MKYLISILLCFELFGQMKPFPFAKGGGVTAQDTSTNIYVDAQNGSNSNDGLTSLTPKLTFAAGEALVNATTDTMFVTGVFDNPFPITKTYGLVLNAVFYSELLTEYTFVPGAEGGDVVNTYYPGTGYDDVWRWGTGSAFYPSYDYGWVGNTTGASQQLALRFRNITEPSSVDSAKLRLHPVVTVADDNVNVTISGEDVANPDTISTRYSFDYRKTNLTTASYNYTLRHWTKDVPDTLTVTNIVTERFTADAYTGSQSMVFFLLDNSSTAEALRSIKMYENTSDSMSELLIYSHGTASNAYYWKSATTEVTALYFGTEAGIEVSDKSLVNEVKEWCWSGDTLYVYGEVLPPSGNADKWVCADCEDVDATDDSCQTITELNAWSLSAGDTVIIKGGETFDDAQFIPQDNVVYTSYGTGRYKLQNSDLTDEVDVIDASGVTNATINNVEVIGRIWVNVKNSSQMKFDNIYCHHYSTTDDDYMPSNGRGIFYGDYTSNLYLTITNSIFVGGFPQTGTANDMFNFVRSGYIFFDDVVIKNTTHALIGIAGANHVRLRAVRGYNQYHHNVDFYGSSTDNLLFEYCLFERAGSGILGTNNDIVTSNKEVGNNFQGSASNSIMRYNVFKMGGAKRSSLHNPGSIKVASISTNNRIYNNVMDSTYGTFNLRMTFSDGDQTLSNHTFFNNSFTRGGDTTWYWDYNHSVAQWSYGVHTDSAFFITWDESAEYSPSGNVFEYNYISGEANNIYNYSSGSLYTTNTSSIAGFTFQNNIDSYYLRDVYDNPDDSVLNYIYWEPETSRGNLYDSVLAKYNGKAPLIDAGRPHTYVNGTQTNDTITVVDARVFFDGWNWLEGDSIKVDTFRVQIVGINTTTNELALSGTVSVTDGQGVYLINPYTHDAYKGTENNIGLE